MAVKNTLDDILELFTTLQDDVFAELHAAMKEDDDFLKAASGTLYSSSIREYLRGFQKSQRVVALALAVAYVQRGRNNVLPGGMPEVEVVLPQGVHQDDDSEAAKEHAEELEAWDQGLLYQMATSSKINPLVTAVDNGLGLGVGFIAYPLIMERYPQKPKAGGPNTEKRKQEQIEYINKQMNCKLYDWRAPHPRSMMWDVDNDPPQYFFEFDDIPLRVAKKQWPDLDYSSGVTPKSARPSDGAQPRASGGNEATVQRIIYVSDTEYSIIVNRQSVLTAKQHAVEGVAPNSLGYAWYGMAEAGFGVPDHEGKLVNTVQGLVRRIRGLIVGKTEDYNLLQLAKYQGINGVDVFTGPEGEEGRAHAERVAAGLVREAGAFWALPGDVKHSIAETPKLAPELLTGDDMVTGLLELLAGPDVLAGAFRDEPTGSLVERKQNALAPFQPMRTNMEQMIAQIINNIHRSIKYQVKGPVTMWGRSSLGKSKSFTLKPERIPEPLPQIFIHLVPTSEGDKEYKWNLSEKQYLAGAIGPTRLSKDGAGVEDVQAETKDRFKADLRAAILPVAQTIVGGMAQQYFIERGVAQDPNAQVDPATGQPLEPAMAGGGGPPQQMNGAAPSGMQDMQVPPVAGDMGGY